MITADDPVDGGGEEFGQEILESHVRKFEFPV
jgi:hypothetical protein